MPISTLALKNLTLAYTPQELDESIYLIIWAILQTLPIVSWGAQILSHRNIKKKNHWLLRHCELTTASNLKPTSNSTAMYCFSYSFLLPILV